MAVLAPTVRIEGPRALATVEAVTVLTRRDGLDTAEVRFPRVDDVDLETFSRGDLVSVYFSTAIGEACVFRGPVTWVSPNLPLVVRASDVLETCAEVRFSHLYAGNMNPVDIAAEALDRANLTLIAPVPGPAEIANMRVDQHSVLSVLDRLREATGFDYFAIPGTSDVYFGPPFPYAAGHLQQRRRYVYRFGRNVLDPQLDYRERDAVTEVVVHLVDADFEQPAVTGRFGPGGGRVRTYSLSESVGNDAAAAAIRARQKAEHLYRQLSTSQYEGTFETFGNPFVHHSHAIRLIDPRVEARNGVFQIDAAEHVLDRDGGYRTRITLGGFSDAA